MAISWEHQFRKARFFAAVMLAIAFFLPVASCTQSSSEMLLSAQEIEQIEESDESRHRIYKYPYKKVSIGDSKTWYILIAFFWPLVALKIREEVPNRAGLIQNTTEVLLCLMTGLIITELSFMYRLEYGGYIAFGGALLYATTSLTDIARLLWQRFRGG